MSSGTAATSSDKLNGMENNLIKLCLNKPQSWNWQLTTSKSSPNIAFPRIQLYDKKGELLADTSEADCVIGSKCRNNGKSVASRSGTDYVRRDSIKCLKSSILPEVTESKLEDSTSDTQSHQVDTYNELVHCDSLKISHVRSKSLQERKIYYRSKQVQESENFLNSIVNQLEKEGVNYKIRRRNSYDVNTKLMRGDNQLHDSELSQSEEGNRAKCGKSIGGSSDLEKSETVANGYVPDGVSNISPICTQERMNYAIVKSKSAITMPLDGKGSEIREKRRCRRTHSVNSLRFSKSILERISEFKRRSSSTDSQEFNEDVEDEEEIDDENKPKYILRTSKAGTLLVCEESFRNRRVRRRARSSSSRSRDLGCGESTIAEPNKRYSQEKITHTFEYVGSDLNEGRKVSPGSEMNSKSRYEREIANIDGLIEKVVAKERAENNLVDMNAKEAESSTAKLKQGNTINGCENQTVERQLDYGDIQIRKRKRSRSRQKTTKYDKCEEQHKNLHQIRRSVSADRTNYRQEDFSSSDESIDKDELQWRYRRSCRRRPKDVSSSKSGDPLATLSTLAVPRKEQNQTNLINDSSDQVFLRLVRRLATLQHPQSIRDSNLQKSSASVPQFHHSRGINLNKEENPLLNTNISGSGDQVCAKFSTELNNNISDENIHHGCDEEIQVKRNSYGRSNCVHGDNPSEVNGEEAKYTALRLINCSEKSDEKSENVVENTAKCYGESSQDEVLRNMGSNASRHSGKGLSGRRSQSSGNLCNGKHPTANGTKCRRNGRKLDPCLSTESQDSEATATSNRHCDENCSRIDSTSTLRSEVHARIGENANESEEIGKLIGVSIKDRNKFSGSLPNHLDVDDIEADTNLTNVQNKYVTSGGVLRYTSENNGKMDRAEYVTVAPKKLPYQLVQQNSQQTDQQYPGKQSSPYNSSSGKGSITSSSNISGSTFKANPENKLELNLKMPPNRVSFDPSCDQGYGSERSPEDEMPPTLLPNLEENHCRIPATSCKLAYWCEIGDFKYNNLEYDFITKDCTFSVQIIKGPRGLGLSISGGVESNSVFPGLIRIKRLFPHQAAWATGMLQPGDILLEVNGTPLTGLTNYEALEVLRTTPNNILLIVCRPNDEQYRKLSPPTEPPKPPQRTSLCPSTSQPLCEPLSPLQIHFNGEFEIIVVKQQGSLGFTLRKEDESVLGHYVRALVREPATTDGRIKPGDKIMAVNDVPLSHMTHEEAVIFLRQAPETVKLRLYRDVAQTPVAALSPTNPENKDISNSLKTKVYLRPEAINLLSDLANRKQTPCGGDSSGSSIKSSATSPRRLRRCAKSSLSDSQTQSDCGLAEYVVCSQPTSSSVHSDSEASTLSQASFAINFTRCASGCCNIEAQTIREGDSESEIEINGCPIDFENNTLADRQMVNRPNFLSIGPALQGGNTPVVSRKPMFQFTVPSNTYELNNLDNEVLDAPIYHQSGGASSKGNPQRDASQDFTSLPCETFLVACKTESDLRETVEMNFNHRNPIYQSARGQINSEEASSSENTDGDIKQEGTKSLLKWKGVMFSPEEEQKQEEVPEADKVNDFIVSSSPTDHENILEGLNTDGYKMITVELHRGWNSRLGFSLQTDTATKRAAISAIYSDSVAAKDGRLRVGDQIVMVNDELVNCTPTSEIIDLLRIIRGSICIVILRKQ